MLFTYINSDDFCEREEFKKTVTTSEAEQGHPLFKRLMGNAKSRQQVADREGRKDGGEAHACCCLAPYGNAKSRQQVAGLEAGQVLLMLSG